MTRKYALLLSNNRRLQILCINIFHELKLIKKSVNLPKNKINESNLFIRLVIKNEFPFSLHKREDNETC